MSSFGEIWLPLVDEPIGGIVAEIQRENPDIEQLVRSPRRLLAFRIFAYVRVGLVCGQLLVDHELGGGDGDETWIQQLLRTPEHRARIEREVRLVAEEIAADPRYAADEPLGPDPGVRERFRDFARGRFEV